MRRSSLGRSGPQSPSQLQPPSVISFSTTSTSVSYHDQSCLCLLGPSSSKSAIEAIPRNPSPPPGLRQSSATMRSSLTLNGRAALYTMSTCAAAYRAWMRCTARHRIRSRDQGTGQEAMRPEWQSRLQDRVHIVYGRPRWARIAAAEPACVRWAARGLKWS